MDANMVTDRSNEILSEIQVNQSTSPSRPLRGVQCLEGIDRIRKGTKSGIKAVKFSGNTFSIHLHPVQEAGLVSRKCEPDTKKE